MKSVVLSSTKYCCDEDAKFSSFRSDEINVSNVFKNSSVAVVDAAIMVAVMVAEVVDKMFYPCLFAQQVAVDFNASVLIFFFLFTGSAYRSGCRRGSSNLTVGGVPIINYYGGMFEGFF